MKKVAVLPWPDMPHCYLVLSGRRRKKRLVGDKWYASHEENTTQFDEWETRTNTYVSFTYMKDGVAAEWDGEAGPIQLWFESDPPAEDDTSWQKPQAHWLWPYATGLGHWSQMAVDDRHLPDNFLEGNYAQIFKVLKSFVDSRINEENNDD